MRIMVIGAGLLLGARGEAQLSNLQTLELAQPSVVALSADGAQVAYVSTQAVLKDDEYRATLFVVPAKGGAAKPLVTERRIFAPQWSADGKSIFYLVKDGDKYQAWRVTLDADTHKQLTHHAEGVAPGLEVDYVESIKPFKVAPDGKRAVFFTRNRAAAEREREQHFSKGVLYTEHDGLVELLDPTYRWYNSQESAPELWLLDLNSGIHRRIWKASEATPGSPSFQFHWSPDGKHLAVFSLDTAEQWIWRTRVDLISMDTLAVHRVRPKLGSVIRPAWSADGQSLLFASEGEITDRSQMRFQYRRYRYSLDDHGLMPLEGEGQVEGDISKIIVDNIKAATSDLVHDCSNDLRQQRVACVREGSMVPPQVVVYDKGSSGTFGAGRVLTQLNPELSRIELGQLSELAWRDEEGNEAKFGLILPAGYRKGAHRYPLVAILYNQYKPGVFSATPYFNSYAPQVYASKGYAVLIQNLPKNRSRYTPGDFETALRHGPQAVARSLRAMLDDVIARGIADPERIGIMGWSWGHFYSTYLLTQHPEWFRAGAAGDGCNHQPAFYWMNPQIGREQEERFFGGGPNGRYADRWRRVAPIMNLDKLRAPLLLEYSLLSNCGVELHQTIQELGGASELVVYPSENHVFERPANRYASMERHFDWFNFWLLGEEDPQPQKAAQYEGWRVMRVRQCERFKGESEPWYCREDPDQIR